MTAAEYAASVKRSIEMGKRRAAGSYAVREAVRLWGLPPAHYLQCCDCEAEAQCYDHRDYRKPLDVWPVCYKCDAIRGAGAPYDGEEIFWDERRRATKRRIARMVAAEKIYKREANTPNIGSLK